MTKVGYKSVLIREEAYEKIKQISEKEKLSICSLLTKAIIEYLEAHKE